MRRLVFDIETNGLLNTTTKLHSLVIQDFDSKKVFSCTDNSTDYMPVADGLKLMNEADMLIGHNIMCFDIPALRKLFPNIFRPRGVIRDTLIISRLLYSDMMQYDCKKAREAKKGQAYALPKNFYGRHSLEAWGYRLSERKDLFGHDTDWGEWSPLMQKYCEQDVAVTRCLWAHFLQEQFSLKAVRLEHEFQEIIFQQEKNGFPFDYDAAEKLYAKLCIEREDLREKLQSLWLPKDKGCFFVPKVNNASKGYVKGVEVWKPKVVPFNPASRKDIAERLFETYGWNPTEFTKTGVGQINDEVLESLPYPEAKQLAKFFLLQKRIGQLGEGKQAWLKLAVKEKDCYRIHGRVTTNGTVTGRCTHHDPNLAQVPAVGVPWGEECRSLFYAPPGWSLLGCDASGLELRCLAHYMAEYDGGAYGQVILHGDIHWANAQNLGLVPKNMVRDKNNEHTEYLRNKIAKRFIYAFLYGAGPYKIGTICDLSAEERSAYLADKGRVKSLVRYLREHDMPFDEDAVAYFLKGVELKEKFLSTLPALNKLINSVQQNVCAHSKLVGLDGRDLPIRSSHSALNTLLQSAGAVAVKKATCYLWQDIRENGLSDKVQQVAHVHDEYQLLVREGYEEKVGQMGVQAFRDAGEYFNFKCPLDGEYKYGKNWAETH